MNHGIVEKVLRVNEPCLFIKLRMRLDQQPADVRVEEPTLRVVWVAIRLGELVMDTMISTPIEQCVLARQTMSKHVEDAKRPSCLIGLVRPEAMCAASHSKCRNQEKDPSWMTKQTRSRRVC